MNIFVLDKNPIAAAWMVCDKHAVKMPTETAQMLSTVVRSCGYDGDVYRASYPKHPCTLWAGRTVKNFSWLVVHGLALCDTYTARYGRRHAAMDIIETCAKAVPDLPDGDLQPFAQAMPDQYKSDDAVAAYRAYYLGEKRRFATWKAPVQQPAWWL